MSWRVISASEVGTSHIADGTACQDSCWAQVDMAADGQPFLSVFVSDGAGSATHGGEGAELAIQTAVALISEKLKSSEFGIGDDLAVECLLSIRERIVSRSTSEQLSVRDFACTFLGVLSSPSVTLAMQIGDGGIVVDVGSGLEVAVIPMTGEYANMTHFVTDEDAVSKLVTKIYPTQARRVAAFSDGLQRLTLNMANNTPHEPFFGRFFQVLSDAGTDKDDELHGALVQFLRSLAVNERTDDDKTLALAVLAT